MFILAVMMAFGISGLAFAGVEILSDIALDGVSAGDWVVLNDAKNNQTVADVYTTNNTLWLLEDSQKNIQAVSNANAIDSAIAVQSNIARVAGTEPTKNVAVNQSNKAELENFRPSDSNSSLTTSESTTINATSDTLVQQSGSSCSYGMSSSGSSASSYSGSSSESLAWNETLDALAVIAGDTRIIDKYGIAGGTVAGSAVVDYDKVIAYGKAAGYGGAAGSSYGMQSSGGHQSSSTTLHVLDVTNTVKTKSSTATSARNAKGANNHILLDATSQQAIKAVSNLNAVASGAAVQNNIASNVGVNGTIAQANSAAVSSGF